MLGKCSSPTDDQPPSLLLHFAPSAACLLVALAKAYRAGQIAAVTARTLCMQTGRRRDEHPPAMYVCMYVFDVLVASTCTRTGREGEKGEVRVSAVSVARSAVVSGSKGGKLSTWADGCELRPTFAWRLQCGLAPCLFFVLAVYTVTTPRDWLAVCLKTS
jgi:hypothetical protein